MDDTAYLLQLINGAKARIRDLEKAVVELAFVVETLAGRSSGPAATKVKSTAAEDL
jgi:hypothetical protein